MTNDMPRQVRKRSGTGIYHVMLRGINRQDIFEDDEVSTPVDGFNDILDIGSWGRFSDHFFDKKELNDVAIFK